MIGEYTISEFMSILAMQGFAGLILFSVFVLMALGLAIIFGQMGVINMAHGEFMILGRTSLTSAQFCSPNTPRRSFRSTSSWPWASRSWRPGLSAWQWNGR